MQSNSNRRVWYVQFQQAAWKFVRAVLALFFIFTVVPVAWVKIFPYSQASADLGQGTTLMIRKWFGVLDNSDFDVVVVAGSKINAGPIIDTSVVDPRFNIYVLQSEIIGVIATTGASTFIDVSKRARPRVINKRTVDPQTSADWRFVGTILETEKKRLVYFPASAIDECIPLLSAGSSPFRTEHQAESRCPKSNVLRRREIKIHLLEPAVFRSICKTH
ncbi:hypothetical protein QTL95_21240 [Rhizobium sp. S152]|uniref:hypothetical protein n=1 Tax=Rhizobium sp. S152 TaxID=3055038 RepID=UPI0025A9C8B3|nr:hypothetical protein [Rhizobium sp. S152]MDM9628426.1 hypothetical protein [Rhizobium sp. S152]